MSTDVQFPQARRARQAWRDELGDLDLYGTYRCTIASRHAGMDGGCTNDGAQCLCACHDGRDVP